MKHPILLLASLFALLASLSSGAVVVHKFNVGNLTIDRLCEKRVVTAVNGKLPGPTIEAHEGDTVIVHVHNKSPYNLTIHWHGIFQIQTQWSDGPNMITQCPIRPGHSYTYTFNIIGQEGTLWWHAHFSWLRATVYGALIVYPRLGPIGYPFRQPHREIPILLGEWWNGNVIDIENSALAVGGIPNMSNAFSINGKTGGLSPCSKEDKLKHIHKVKVEPHKTYLLRIINAALNNQLYFKIANHSFTVVAADASYTDPYHTDVVLLGPGQTVDVLTTTKHSTGKYYMAAHAYASAPGVPFDNTTTTGILQYEGDKSKSAPVMPVLPPFNDTATANKFYGSLTSLKTLPNLLPQNVDEHMFIAFGLGLLPCTLPHHAKCQGPRKLKAAASMNNVSFQLPTKLSLLQAYFNNVGGIYTEDFPTLPPVKYDYTKSSLSFSRRVRITGTGTRVKRIPFNTTLQIVLQDTSIVAVENHPIHLHGNNFYVLAQGSGNYNPNVDPKKFNLVNPQQRNTVAVPAGGWAVIRFQASNPGVWFMHCHLDVHLAWGLAMAFIVENGPTLQTILPPPPSDLPKC